MKKITGLLVCLMMILTAIIGVKAEDSPSQITATGSYKIVVEGYDWGPSVSKTIIKLNQTVTGINNGDIAVTENKMWYSGNIEAFNREVTTTYLSDENGLKVTNPSNYITIEMKVSPNDGSPFIYQGLNNWTKPYYLTFTVKNDFSANEGLVHTLTIDQDPTGRIMPQADRFTYNTYTARVDGTSYSYAAYTPQTDNKKNPLIIWLNGGGEGGSDATIATLGNKVTALIGDKIQRTMARAYVLVPQAPTAWMRGYSTTNGGDSIYTESLMELIKTYVANNSDIDPDRIYIGGCSNGGYMTLQMVTKYPDYFAAAFPICTGYSSATMTDENLSKIKDLPLWFLYAENDTVLDPTVFSIPLIQRLRAMNAGNLHVSSPAKVIDTSGLYFTESNNRSLTPYEYNGHWSWIYAFNSESYDDNDSSLELFAWLAKQKRPSQTTDDSTTTKDTGSSNVTDSKTTAGFSNVSGSKTKKKIVKTGDILDASAFIFSTLISLVALILLVGRRKA